MDRLTDKWIIEQMDMQIDWYVDHMVINGKK